MAGGRLAAMAVALLVAGGLLTCPADRAGAAMTYYVSTAGNDTHPGTLDRPWRTLRKAAESLVAGDTISVRQGTYRERVVVRRSGTSQAPITFAAYAGEVVTVDGTGLTMQGRDGVFVVSEREHIRVVGLRVTNSPAPAFWCGTRGM